MRRSGDIGISLGGTYKRRSYVFAFISTEHAGNWESPTPSTSSPVYRYAAGRDLACAFLHIHNRGGHRSRAGQFTSTPCADSRTQQRAAQPKTPKRPSNRAAI